MSFPFKLPASGTSAGLPSSSRQKLLSKPTEQEEEKWYAGDVPTTSESLARIYTISQTDPAKGRELWDAYQTFASDPSSPLYDPYRAPTNPAAGQLAAMGVDVSGKLDKSWAEANLHLQNDETKPLFTQLLDAEANTQQAETEWAALQEEIRYWVGRKDRNYSDEQIRQKINWDAYPTLKAMDESRTTGSPLVFNRAIGYSSDALNGAIWAARNHGGTGNPVNDGVHAVLGDGVQWQQDDAIAARLDPTNAQYNPYAVGSTLDDAALYFGTDHFDPDWLTKNSGVLTLGDETMRSYYQQVFDAEQITRKAEEELAALQEVIQGYLAYSTDPDALLGWIDMDDYPTLQRMDETLKGGELLPTTRKIGYSWQDVADAVRKSCASGSPDDFFGGLAAEFGMAPRSEAEKAVAQAKSAALNTAGRDIAEAGTDAEKLAYQTTRDPNYAANATYVQQLLSSQSLNPQIVYDKVMQDADSYAAAHYMSALEQVRPYEQARQQHDAAQQQLDSLLETSPWLAAADTLARVNADNSDEMEGQINLWLEVDALINGTPQLTFDDVCQMGAEEAGAILQRVEEQFWSLNWDDVELATELEYLVRTSGESMAEMETGYHQGLEQLERVRDNYAFAQEYAAVFGAKLNEGYSATALMDYAYQYGDSYNATTWSSMTAYDAALANGATQAQVALAAKYGKISTEAQINTLKKVREELSGIGVTLSKTYQRNIDREIARLERNQLDADYFLLREQPDFEQVAEETRQKIKDAWSGFHLFPQLTKPGGYDSTDYNFVNTDASFASTDGRPSNLIFRTTKEEQDTYLYLLATQGSDAAKAYYNHLKDETYGILTVRDSEMYRQRVNELSSSDWLGAAGMTALSILSSPAQIAGTIYSGVATLQGKEINPYHSAFGATTMVQETRSAVKKSIDAAIGEGTPGAYFANLGYDALTGAGDSMLGALTLGAAGSAITMGASAAASAIQDAKLRGATDEQALLLGGVTWVAEAWSERIAAKNFIKWVNSPSASVKEALVKLAADAGMEGLSEAVSEGLTSVADTLIMQELSNFEAAVRQYEMSGLSKEEAEKKAITDTLFNILYAGAVGVVSSGMSKAASSGADAVAKAVSPASSTRAAHDATEVALPAEPDSPEAPASVEATEDNLSDETVGEPKPTRLEYPPTIPPDARPAAPPSIIATEISLIQSLIDDDDGSGTGEMLFVETVAPMLANETVPGSMDTATAAAQKLVREHGTRKTSRAVQIMLMREISMGIPAGELEAAITVAALTDGESHEVLNDIIEAAQNHDIVGDHIPRLIEASKAEAVDLQEQVRVNVRDSLIGRRVTELIAEGGLDGLRSYRQAAAQARQNAGYAQKQLEQAEADLISAQDHLATVHEQYMQDPSNDGLQGAHHQAIAAVEAAATAVSQMAQAAEIAQAKGTEAQQALETMRDSMLGRLREQAISEVDTYLQEQQRMKADADAWVEERRQSSNVAALNAEAFVEQNYSDASEADQTQARDAFVAAANEDTPQVATTEAETQTAAAESEPLPIERRTADFLAALARRYNVTFRVVDSPAGAQGWYKNGVVTINARTTQSEAIVKTAVHELVHHVELSGEYQALADAVRDYFFGGDMDAYSTEVQAVRDLYTTHKDELGIQEDIDDSYGERELIAEYTMKLLTEDDPGFIDRIVSERPSLAVRIAEALKRFVNKLRGVKDTQLDKIRKVEGLFRKALEQSADPRARTLDQEMRDSEHPQSEQFSITQFARAVGMKAKTNAEGIPYVILDEAGNEVKKVTPEMVAKAPVGKLINAALEAGNITQEVADSQFKGLADLMTMVAEHNDKAMVWEIAGAELFSAIKSNSDKQYSTTVDFGTICSKTREVVSVISDTMLRLGRGLTRDEVLEAYRNTHAAGMAVPCPVCYVFSRWMGVPSLLETMRKGQERFANATDADVNAYLDSVRDRYGVVGEELATTIGKVRTKLQNQLKTIDDTLTKGVFKKNESEATLMERAKSLQAELDEVELFNWVNQVLCKTDSKRKPILDARGQVTVDPAYKPVPNEVLLDLRQTGEFASKYGKAWTFRTTRGAGMGKAILPYSGAELGDTVSGVKRMALSANPFFTGDDKAALRKLKNATNRAKAQNLIGGQRFQSTSDYRPEWGLDYIMTFLEMQAIGAKGQLYTKVIEAVDMFATAGIEVNLSIMGKGDGYHLDENGNPVLGDEDFSSVTGIDFKSALQKTQDYDNVQMILVGLNDDHIRAAMADGRITFIIPWHSSGNSKTVLAKMMSSVGERLTHATDYSETQSDKVSPDQTPEQKALWDLRVDILTGKLKKGITKAQKALLEKSTYLAAMYEKFYVDKSATDTYGVKLSKAQASQIFPHEYWDTTLPVEQADENGKRFVEYCESMGIIPRFSQFAEDTGYWKLLIDRRMYNRDGTYHEPQKIDVTKVKIDSVASEVSQAKVGTHEQISQAVQATLDNIRAQLPAEPVDLQPETDLYAADGESSLPSPDMVTRQARSWQENEKGASYRVDTSGVLTQSYRIATPPGQNPQNPADLGVRQFAGQTAQNSNAIPAWLQRSLWGDRFYERDTNRAQAERAYMRASGEGWEASHERLMNQPAWNADDNVEALVLLHMALRPADQGGWDNPAAAMEIAHRFNVEGTQQGQTLQARQLFQRMNPTGMRMWAAGQAEATLQTYMDTHRPRITQIRDSAREVERDIARHPAGEPIIRDEDGSVVITPESVSRWGIPVNERQQALIDRYHLNNVSRPGLHYNRATTQQRMLEAILATPDPNAPTGMGLTLVERLEMMRAGLAVITVADLNYITDRMQEYADASEEDQAGRLGDLALARAYEAYGNITPVTGRERRRSWRYTSMLLSIPSAVRNVIGNAAQGTANTAAHGLAVLLDAAVSTVTHERTMALNTIQERAEGWHAFVDETVNTYLDHFVDQAVTRRGNDRFDLHQRGRLFQHALPEGMRQLQGFLMSVGDRNVWRMAFVRSMAEQQRVADLNGTAFDPETAAQRATEDANYATFSEDNAVRDALNDLKRVPVVGELLDFIMPFTGIPTNIIRRMGQYSPFGLAWSVGRTIARAWNGETFDQRYFVNGVARGITGSAMFAAGMLLYSLGAIKLGTGEEDDDKVYGLHTAMGQQYAPYIRIDGQYVSLSALAPFISPIIMGASALKIVGEDDNLANAALSAAIAAGDQVFDASYMANLSDILGGYGSPTENALLTIGSSMISQNIPSVVSQFAAALDPYVRDTKDKNRIMQMLYSGLFNKIPGLREMLPEKVDVSGRSVPNTDQGVLAFVDPFNRAVTPDDPALLELDRLQEQLGSTGFLPSDALSGTKTALSGVAAPVEGEDKETYRKRYGELWRLGGSTYDADGNRVNIMGVTDLIQTSWYQRMSDAEKAEAIRGVVAAAKAGAVYEMGEKLGHTPKSSGSTSDGYVKKTLSSVPAQLQGRYPELDRMFDQTGDGAFLPKGIGSSFSRSKVQYELSGKEYDRLWTLYIEELDKRMAKIDWSLSPEEVAAAVAKAYDNAASTAKDRYAASKK